jgi:ribulose 1,5-bisphosphate synthetase/thiazole synthase
MEEQGGPYRIADQYHSQGRTIRVIHVGAGAAGLLMAYKMKKLFDNYELVCYEKCVYSHLVLLNAYR